MNLMFWKKKKPLEGNEAETVEEVAPPAPPSEGADDVEAAAKPGVLSRLRGVLAGFGSRLRKQPEPGAGEDATIALPTKPEGHRPLHEEKSAPPPVRNMKKRMILGGALGLAMLLFAGVGFMAWKWYAAPHANLGTEAHGPIDNEGKGAKTAHAAAPGTDKAPESAEMQAQIAALKKQNEQMQSELEALKKTDRDGNAQVAPPANGGKAGVSGDILLSGKDPKASAQALKQAIDEMNAASGGGKPHKPAE